MVSQSRVCPACLSTPGIVWHWQGVHLRARYRGCLPGSLSIFRTHSAGCLQDSTEDLSTCHGHHGTVPVAM